MNGIDKITARIETQAVADAAQIAQEAKAQCEAVRAEGEKKAQERYWLLAQEGVKSVEDRVQRLAKAADMEAKKNILSYKQSIMTEAFAQAEKQIREMSDDRYTDFLAGQAARAAVSGSEEIVLNAKDKQLYGSKVLSRANARLAEAKQTAKLTLAADTGDFEGGLVLRNGNIAVNCTIEALMAQAREDMASEVAAGLFA